ncbi:MAG: hypothetical protein S4CHLAM81_08550 [Chlamydiales bacterium]|nr:hypothetical protein [Chlamydiales bacterium]MCH9635637.1 hypothetical protein [Chlamydiales bacterium]
MGKLSRDALRPYFFCTALIASREIFRHQQPPDPGGLLRSASGRTLLVALLKTSHLPGYSIKSRQS